jgi:hypothetical protein
MYAIIQKKGKMSRNADVIKLKCASREIRGNKSKSCLYGAKIEVLKGAEEARNMVSEQNSHRPLVIKNTVD